MKHENAVTHPELVLFKGLVQAIRSALNLQQMLNLILDLLINNVNAEVGTILLKDGGSFVPRAGLGLSDRVLKEVRLGARSLLELIAEKTEPFLIPDLLGEQDVKTSEKMNLRSVLCAPLMNHGEQIGIIVLANKSATTGAVSFSQSDLVVLGSVAAEISMVVENALLYEEVNNLKNYNESILNSLPNGIITTDLEGTIITVNKGAEYILNVSGAASLGQNIGGLFARVLRSDFDIMKVIRSGENLIDYEISMEKTGGEIAVLAVSVSVLKNGLRGKIIGSAIHLSDFTQKKFLESQVARAEQLAALGEMSAGVAHEIRNPLTSIQGFTQLLPQKTGDAKFMEKYVEIVTRETSRLNNIVERFLAFARPREAGFQECNVTDIVQNALSLLHYQIEKNHINLERKLTEVPPVRGDWQQLEQVFINIILNAVQVMDKPEKTLSISIGSLLKKLMDNRYKEFVAIRIADNGPGIPADRVDRIFNPFYTTRPDGTGLGLSITSQIIEKHNGSIEVNSKPGEGTAFTVYLPVAET
jgi:PAS domain S-box-containing protein